MTTVSTNGEKGGFWTAPMLTIAISLLFAGAFVRGQDPETESASAERSELAYLQGLRFFQMALGESDPQSARGRFQEALVHFKKAAQEATPYYLAVYYLGVTYGKLGMLEEALTHLRWTVQHLDRSPVGRLGSASAHRDLGVALYRTGRYAEALPEFQKAAVLEPDDGLAQLYAGFCHFQLEERPAALAAFQRAAQLDPALSQRAAYYSGLSYLVDEAFAEALTALTQASSLTSDSSLSRKAARLKKDTEGLAGPQPAASDPGFKGRAERLKKQAEAAPAFSQSGEGKPWRLRFSLGGQFDSNLILQAEDDPVFGQISDQRDFAGFFSAGGGYDLRRSESDALAVEYDYYRTIQKDISDFNLEAHLPRLRSVWKPRSGFTLGAEAGAPLYRLGGQAYLQRFYVRPFVDVSLKPWTATQAFYSVSRQDYKVEFFDPERDGLLQEFGFRQSFRLQRADRLAFLGYRRRLDDPRSAAGDEFEYAGDGIEAGVQTPVAGGSSVGFRYAFRHDDYRFPNSLDLGGRRRRDNIHDVRVTFRKPLTPYLELHLDYVGIVNNSNIEHFQHRRQIGSFSLHFAF